MRPVIHLDHTASTPGRNAHHLVALPAVRKLAGNNHNETVVSATPAVRRIGGTNHNETFVSAPPAVRKLSGTNHNETVVTSR